MVYGTMRILPGPSSAGSEIRLAGKLMEGPGLNTGIEQHERIADHIVAAGPMPYHRFCRV